MVGRLAFGFCAVVTGRAEPKHLSVINFCCWLPGCLSMAGLTARCRVDVRCRFADGIRSIVTSYTGRNGCLRVGERAWKEGCRCVASLAICP